MPAEPSSRDPVATWLAAQPHLVLDGGLASELERRGADLDDPLWSARVLLEQPGLIRDVHLDYFLAGADVATSASYQASFEGFARRGLDADAARALMRQAVTLAIEARDLYWRDVLAQAAAEGRPPTRRRPLVAASIGPYGAMRADGSEYRGDYGLDEEALMDFHRPRLEVLATSGADLLACETLPCLAEARALARLLDEAPDRRGWISFSCRDGRHTSQGEDFGDCVAALEPYRHVVAVGVNCTAPQHLASLIARARERSSRPIVVYPNAGEVWDAARKRWLVPDGHEHLAFDEQALRWSASGAALIGGCCRTTPRDIAALRRRWAGD